MQANITIYSKSTVRYSNCYYLYQAVPFVTRMPLSNSLALPI